MHTTIVFVLIPVDIPNAAQIRNTQLANTIHYHAEQTRRMVQNLGNSFANSAAAEIILKDLSKNDKLIRTIVHQLFGKPIIIWFWAYKLTYSRCFIDSMNAATKTILLSMHREPGLNSEKPTPASTNAAPSLYMKELQEFMHRSWNLHIVGFSDRQCVELW